MHYLSVSLSRRGLTCQDWTQSRNFFGILQIFYAHVVFPNQEYHKKVDGILDRLQVIYSSSGERFNTKTRPQKIKTNKQLILLKIQK